MAGILSRRLFVVEEFSDIVARYLLVDAGVLFGGMCMMFGLEILIRRYESYEYVSKGAIETIEMNRFSRKPMDIWESWDHIHRSGWAWVDFFLKCGSNLRHRGITQTRRGVD